jgi:hypothetical protein
VHLRSCLVVVAIFGCAGTEGTLITTHSDGGTEGSTGGSGGSSGGAGSSGSGGSSVGPTPGMSMQIQLSGELDDSLDVDLYDIDLHTNSASDFATLRRAGRFVACYFSAGTLEGWRGDGDGLPAAAIGNAHQQYPSERWLDVRSTAVRELMRNRIELAQSKGCDAIQPANLAVFAADSGLSVTRAENEEFARYLATTAHALGLSVAWSDEPNLFAGLEQVFDWGLAIQCIEFGRCEAWSTFRNAGKAVFVIEIGDESDANRVCQAAADLGLPAIIKDNGYTAFRVGCP